MAKNTLKTVKHALRPVFQKSRTRQKGFTLLTLIFFLLTSVINLGILAGLGFAGTLDSSEMAGQAAEFINERYLAGEKIDGYAVYVLSLAGEDLGAARWTTGSPEYVAGCDTLKSKIEKLADLLGDGNSMITFITGTQNADGSFGPYANEYGTKAPLQALALVKPDTVGTAVYDQVERSLNLAVSYFKEGYRSGNMTYDVNGGGLDYRCVEALAVAGGDLSAGDWTYNGVSLRDAAVASAAATADSPLDKDAVYLAKELTVLCAVCPGAQEISVLADAILAKQDTSVPGKVHFGGTVYDNVLILTALGKAGRLGGIEEGALEYLNSDTFKHPHSDSWGNPAGAAWGGYYQEEPDLTAQVLTALSYFSGAGDPGSAVANAIQEGLAYLADIQDDDTAGITAQWDSTFATAEVLIALKSLGKDYEEYAGAASTWVKNTRTKTIAQCLLALSRWDDTMGRLDRLAGLLAGRQRDAEPGRGSFENSVYSDMWAYIALGEAGKISCIDTAAAKEYILSKQGEDGSWGEIFGTDYYPDFLSAIQAIQALTCLPGADDQQVQAAISKGLAYLKGLQQADGGVYSTWDDPAVDNSGLIVTLKKLDIDPSGEGWKNSAGLTPVDYLLNNTMNEDGSFGSAKNVYGAAQALSALILVGGQGGSGEGGQPDPQQGGCSVEIAVVGLNGELLYGPGSVTVSKDGRWGCTALGALDATGLGYIEEDGFVKRIEDQANSGMNGWMYKVNSTVPAVAARDKQVKEGDRIIWWYSTDMNSPGPAWDSLFRGSSTTEVVQTGIPATLPATLQPSKEAVETLDQAASLLGLKKDAELGAPGEPAKTVVVAGSGSLPDWAEIVAMKNELSRNIVDLAQKVEAANGATLTDNFGELALTIQAGALDSNLTITIEEDAVSSTGSTAGGSMPPVPENYRMVSPLYQFGPDGTAFAVPATLILKVAWPPLVRPENLALARYDGAQDKWIAVPAVVDAANELILAKISHFSGFAVLVKEERKPFGDVNANACGWAQDAVEVLAGAGVLAGVDGTHYEPERAVKRAELASIMVKALNLPAAEGNITFKDVGAKQWYYDCVAAAAGKGLLKGYEDGTFCPDRAVTREELAAILVRALDLKSPSGAGLSFTDAGKVSGWAKDSVAAVASAGLVKGYPDGSFKPQGTVTRAECAVMIYRALVDF